MSLQMLQMKLEEVVTYDDLKKLEAMVCTRCRRPSCRGCKAMALIQDWRDFVLPFLK
ncbi:hypothetical protein MTAT_20230 [Moorella thermoacetica]|uniref:Uncharacterized protein n=1 Tax=Neomoorella thermoacetica TaxID=1525 RepID=A0AAC9HJ32_NEOTH|nr:hypothetical protein [Moorella thermoacetica]AOQ24678.1 hypothetical protein Maut_02250 [Moorella thermoacetica]TYL12781.1 hypothetical protein MTAT_20230 [Moorella thermoacetica]